MTTWEQFSSNSYFQQADDSEKERLRNDYWNRELAPVIPDENRIQARQMFDQHTRPRGNPDQGYFGDMQDAFQQGMYSGAGDMVAGTEMLFGGDGDNALSTWLRNKADEQLDDMSPSGQQAMHNFGIEEDPNSATGYGFKDEGTAAGFGLQFMSGLGSFAPSMVPGMAASKLLSGVAKGKRGFDLASKAKNLDPTDLNAARRLKALDSRIDTASQVTGYGVTGGAMIGAGGAEDAKQAIMAAGYEDLKDLPRFQEVYRQMYQDMGGSETGADTAGANTAEAFRRARVKLAYEAADDAFGKSFATGAASMGIAGPMLDKVVRGVGAGSRIGNATKGAGIEGAQEFGEGYGQQVASNMAQQNLGMDVNTFDGAMEQGLSGAIIGAPVGGSVGMIPSPRNKNAVLEPQRRELANLHSQRQSLEAQLQEPDADIESVHSLLRDNALKMATLESVLESEAGRQPLTMPEQSPVVEQPVNPELQGWQDRNQAQPQPGGVTEFGDSLDDARQYDQPAYDARQYDQPAYRRSANPANSEYNGNEEQDLQTYTGRVSGLNKVLRQFNWQPNQKKQRKQLKTLVNERRQIERQAREQAKQSPQNAYTPVNIVDRINEIKTAHAENRTRDFNRAMTELQASNLQERERLNAQELNQAKTQNDSRLQNPQYRQYLSDAAGELESQQTSEKRNSAKLQDDDSLISAIGKLGGLNVASVEDTVAESLDAHIKT